MTSAVQYVRRQTQKTGDTKDFLFLHGEDIKLLFIELDEDRLDESRYQLIEGGIEIFDLPDSFLLTIVTEIHPETNLSLEGLYTSGGKFTTQCEAE